MIDKKTIYELLKSLAIKEATKRIFGAAVGGIKGFIVSLLIDYVFKKGVIPASNWVIRKIKKGYYKTEGFFKKKKLVKAKEEKNEEKYNDIIDDL